MFENAQKSNFMKIFSVGAELFHMDRRTDITNERTNSTYISGTQCSHLTFTWTMFSVVLPTGRTKLSLSQINYHTSKSRGMHVGGRTEGQTEKGRHNGANRRS